MDEKLLNMAVDFFRSISGPGVCILVLDKGLVWSVTIEDDQPVIFRVLSVGGYISCTHFKRIGVIVIGPQPRLLEVVSCIDYVKEMAIRRYDSVQVEG